MKNIFENYPSYHNISVFLAISKLSFHCNSRFNQQIELTGHDPQKWRYLGGSKVVEVYQDMVDRFHDFMIRTSVKGTEELEKYFHPISNKLIVNEFQRLFFLQSCQLFISTDYERDYNFFHHFFTEVLP